MEHANGVQLQRMWPKKWPETKRSGVSTLSIKRLRKSQTLTFQRMGVCVIPIYASVLLQKHHWVKISALVLTVEGYIGTATLPSLGTIRIRGPRHGPWKCILFSVCPSLMSLQGSDRLENCDGLIDAGIAKVPPNTELRHRPRYHGSPSDHHSLLDSGQAVIKKMSDARILTAAAPILLHPDLNKRSIFVLENDATVVTGIIDWQSASVEPAFWYAYDIPDFASTPDILGQTNRDNELCGKAFSACDQFLIPKLAYL